MKSLVIKRSIVIAGHKTSVSLEDPFWSELKEIAERQHMTLSNMVGDIDTQRQQGNLSSAIRLFVLDQVRSHPPEFAGNGMRTAANATNVERNASIVPTAVADGALGHG
ncbi:MAG TPA: ribbon-helix-helix domain-containing protein [Pseudolabrys sp.]|nr:ribbon-helix-helix domain-containing protein [Pseudolabrys sp.]